MAARLNVNIDHVATVRQARRAPEPSLVAAAMLCEGAGADGITIHLRADRRHIQDADLHTLRRAVTTYLNVELNVSDEMINIALDAARRRLARPRNRAGDHDRRGLGRACRA